MRLVREGAAQRVRSRVRECLLDTIVKQVRFTGWSETQAGDRTVRKELRQVLKKFGLPLSGPLLDNAYGYVRENY